MAARKIDVHAHFIPDFYRKALLDHGFTYPDGMPAIPAWNVEDHVEFMNATGISKSILSITSLGTNISPDPAYNKALTRQVNEYAASTKLEHPLRFGFFASLPFGGRGNIDSLDLKATCEEIVYAFDELNADGVALLSNSLGVYLGDPCLRPVLAELDKRAVVVLVHPTVAPCSGPHGQSLSPGEEYENSSPLANVYRGPLFEFFFDSARSILDLLASGTFLRFPNIRWVVTHCGNVLPSLLDRMFLVLRLGQKFSMTRDALEVTEEQILKAVRKQMWFDLAGNPVPTQLRSLLNFTDTDRLMFGSDVPWTPFEVTKGLIARLEVELPQIIGEEAKDLVFESVALKLLE